MRRRWKRSAKVGALGLLCGLNMALSPPDPLADGRDRRALLLAKVLSYERRLSNSKGDSVGIAVVYAAGNAESKQAANDWIRSFRDLGAVKVHGAPVQALEVAYDPQDLPEYVRKRGIDVLLVCPGIGSSAVASLTRRLQILSAADAPAGVEKGLSVGVFIENGKPKIVINMESAKSEGAQFSSMLLRLAKTI